MPQIIITDMDDTILVDLEELARFNRLTVEAQAKNILAERLEADAGRRRRYLTAQRIAAMTPAGVTPTDSVLLLREDRAR